MSTAMVDVSVRNGVTLLTPAHVGAHDADAVFSELLEQARWMDGTLLVVDLRHIEHLHTASARCLLELRQFTRSEGIELRVCNLQESARRTLAITRISPLFEIHDSVTAALVA